MRLAKSFKAPDDRKRYITIYEDWLDTGETLLDVTYEVQKLVDGEFETSTELSIDGSTIALDGKDVSFFVNDGELLATYKVLLTATTSDGQIKVDHVLFFVQEP